MQIPRLGVLPGLCAALVLTTTLACGGDKKDGASAGKVDAKTPSAEGKTDEVEAPAADGAGSGGAGSGQAGEAGGSSGAAGSGAAADAGADSSGAAGSGSGGEAADADGGATTGEPAEGTDGGPDSAALLKELKKKRTKDARVTEIIAQLEAAEVETIELAKALTARGKALHATPERAKAMFELALEKDAQYPDPAFELAKQAAVLGELDEAKKWLGIVRDRKGKKLLKQIEFDPMWEILKDDPDVRAMLK